MADKIPVQTVNLTIDEVEDILFGFRGGEYRESINGILPTLTAKFVCEIDKFPLDLTEVNMTLTVNEREWRLVGNVDQIKFDVNIITLYITLARRDFYFVSNSAKFLSSESAIKHLYFGNDIEATITNNTPRELNQIGVTDYKYLNTILRSMNAPSAFAYTMNSLVVTSLANYEVALDIDPSIHRYYVEDKEKFYGNDRKSSAELVMTGVQAREDREAFTLASWDGLNIYHNSDNSDLIENIIDNTKFLKSKKLSLNLIFQYIPEVKCGQIIRIDIPGIEKTRFLVTERLGLIGGEIKFRYKLLEL